MRIPQRFALLGSLLLAVCMLMVLTPTAFAATAHPAERTTGYVNSPVKHIIFQITTSVATIQPTGHVSGLADHGSSATRHSITPLFQSEGPGENEIDCAASLGLLDESGYIYGDGSVTCDEPVASIQFTVLVYRNGSLYTWTAGSVPDNFSLYLLTTKKCASTSKATWSANLVGGVEFPAGFEPGSTALNLGSGDHQANC